MRKSVHLVLQGKGGVGKSLIARLLVEYMIHTKTSHASFDADPVNQSLCAVDAFGAKAVKLLDPNGDISARSFDTMMGDLLQASEEAIIVDSGASAFLPLMGYIEASGAIEALLDEDCEVFIHTVVTAGAAFDDTMKGFAQIAKRFGDTCNVVVWTNPFFGDLEQNGTKFIETEAVQALIEQNLIIGHVPMPVLHRLNQEDFEQFLAQNIPFSEATAKENAELNTMVRRRLIKLHTDLMAAIGDILSDSEDASTDAA